jgi:hypothetical protein
MAATAIGDFGACFLLAYVTNEVPYMAEQLGKQQYPTMSMKGDNFPVAVY